MNMEDISSKVRVLAIREMIENNKSIKNIPSGNVIKKIITAYHDLITKELIDYGEIDIPSLGKFYLRRWKGKLQYLDGKKTMKFYPQFKGSKVFKDKIRSGN